MRDDPNSTRAPLRGHPELGDVSLSVGMGRERDRLLEQIQTIAHLGAWSWLSQSGDVVATDEVFVLYGLEPSTKTTFAALLDKVAEEDREDVETELRDALGQGHPFSLEHRVGTADQVRWLRMRGRPDRADDGSVRRMYGTVQDITSEREVLLRVEADERRFRRLIESAPDAVILFRGDGTITYANALAAEMFGYPLDSFQDLSVEDLMPTEVRARHQMHRSNFLKTPDTRPMGVGLDLEGLRRDGSKFPLDISLSPIRSAEGLQVLSFVRDMTEQRVHAEAILRRKQALEINDRVVQGLAAALHALEAHDIQVARSALQATMSNARAMMGSLTLRDSDPLLPGDLVRSASAGDDEAVTRAPEQEPLSTGDIRVVVADDTPAIRRMLQVLLDEAGGMRIVGEASDGAAAVAAVQDLAPDLLLLDLAMPEMDGLQVLKKVRTDHPDTSVVIVSGYAREHLLDVTKGLGADAYIEKGAPTPTVVATLRSIRDEMNERRGISQTPAAASSEAYQLYLHELRLPLEAAARTANTLTSRTQTLDPEVRIELLDRLTQHIHDAEQVLQLISDATRIEDRSLRVQRRAVDLDEMLRTIVGTCGDPFRDHPLLFVSAGSIVGMVDEQRISEIVMQLLNNAATFSPDGTTITLMLSKEDDAAVVRVIDEGPGVPSHFRPRLFGRFQRLDSSKPGVGLGLHVGRAVARAHDGDLELEDGRPENCVFKLTLPIVATSPLDD
jgi:PAS domain S-box-containing protein